MKLLPRHKKILACALQMPGASHAELAKASKTRLHTVRYVMQLYSSRGWLDQYYFVRSSRLGLRLINLFFSMPLAKAPAVIKMLERDPRIVWLTEQTGTPRYEITAMVKDPLELERLLDSVTLRTGAVFQDRFWAIETNYYEFGQRFLGSITRKPVIEEVLPYSGPPVRLSELDKQLIDLKRGSHATSSATTAELSRLLKVPHTTVAYHLKKLTDLGVLCPPLYYINMEQSGMSQYQIILTLNQNPPRLEELLLKFCGESPVVSTLIKGFGGWDYKMIIFSETPATGLEVQDSLEQQFSGMFSEIMLLTRRRIISARTDLTHHPELV